MTEWLREGERLDDLQRDGLRLSINVTLQKIGLVELGGLCYTVNFCC